jgi:hypothetical protein
MAAGWKDALMADTGAPWNIPYVEPSDLVRDYPAADEAQALAIAAGLSAATSEGIGPNVVQTVKDDVTTTTSATFVDVSGLSLSITPSSTSSKILLVGHITLGMDGSDTNSAAFRLVRDSTAICLAAAATGPAGAIDPATGGFTGTATFGSDATVSFVFVDSPNIATATTYKVQFRRGAGGTAKINKMRDSNPFNGTSSITAIEVAA